MKNLNIENLSIDEVNQILTSLSQMPYIQVHQLIHKIQFQAEQQLQAAENGESKVSQNGQKIIHHDPATIDSSN